MQYQTGPIEFCLENSASIFRGLSQKEKEIIAENHLYAEYGKGQAIYREGEKSRGILCLASGKIKLFSIGVGGREQILKVLGTGDLAGYTTLYTEAVWPESALALEESAVCFLERNSLVRILKKNPELAYRLSRYLSVELHAANRRLISLTQKHVRGRIAESLLMLSDVYGLENDSKTLKVRMSREDLAHLSNMTTSNAIRTLSNMQTEGILGLKGKSIVLLDEGKLEHISETG
jgi:CRP-like cAMP-binding protein